MSADGAVTIGRLLELSELCREAAGATPAGFSFSASWSPGHDILTLHAVRRVGERRLTIDRAVAQEDIAESRIDVLAEQAKAMGRALREPGA